MNGAPPSVQPRENNPSKRQRTDNPDLNYYPQYLYLPPCHQLYKAESNIDAINKRGSEGDPANLTQKGRASFHMLSLFLLMNAPELPRLF